MVPAGRFRHRVTFEELVTTLDSDGAQDEGWVMFGGRPLPAEIVALSGRELIAAQAVNSKVTTRIRLRYRPGFNPSMRAVHRGTTYNIEGVIPDPDSNQRFVTLICSSGTNQG
jgi:SPP1 family predicted phage head-tail adaptor